MRMHKKIGALVLFCACLQLAATEVSLRRVPDGGIQPQAAQDAKGVLHLIYFKGEPAKGDIFYVRSADNAATFSKPLQVSQGASAIAMGNIRGAHLALGKNGRAHVAWMGSSSSNLKGPNNEAPMLYSRLNDAGTAFEPQRNLIAVNYGLDGGGTVAADAQGNVYVFWHGKGAPTVSGEENRKVWVARSTDDGKTFAPETAAFTEATGVCGCCGMSASADKAGNVYALYRAAAEKVNRDMYLLSSKDKGASFSDTKVDEWKLNACPMSSSIFAESPTGMKSAWENNGQVYFAGIGADMKPGAPIQAPGNGTGRKHPALASNASGETLLVWTEGMGWDRGGKLAWQIFGKDGRATADKGSARDVPKWSLVAAFARADGGFTILY